MSDKIGRLGTQTGAAQGTWTGYTVPANKGARVKIMYRGVAGVNSTLKVTVAGIDIFLTAALTSGQVSSSNTTQMHFAQAAAALVGGTDPTTVAPGPKEYFLQSGDTITYTIGTADFSSMIFEVVGVEVDN